MKSIKYILTLFVILAAFSCSEDFIDKKPPLQMSNELSLSSYKNLQLAVNGAYAPLYDDEYYGRDFIVYAAIKGDNAKSSTWKNSGRFQIEYNWDNNNANTIDVWQRGYQVIAAANNVINALEGFEEPGVTQAQLDQLKGESLFLRALAHFDLVRTYAQPYSHAKDGNTELLGVPIIRETKIQEPERNTVVEVYEDLIVPDLLDAEKIIGDPERGTVSNGFASKEAVQALLAKVYLYMENWDEAATYASKVINSGKFQLYSAAGYADAWGTDEATEVIFQVYGNLNQSYYPAFDEIGYMFEPVDGYGDVVAATGLMNLFEDGDVRADVFNTYSEYPGEQWSAKYPGKSKINENNIPVLRLSEMYLIRAEAVLNGANGNALADYNAIRTSRGLTAAANVSLQDVYNERRRELNFEGNALFDLARLQKPLERIDEDVIGDAPQTVPFPDDRWAGAIPIGELEANPNIEPNPAYN